MTTTVTPNLLTPAESLPSEQNHVKTQETNRALDVEQKTFSPGRIGLAVISVTVAPIIRKEGFSMKEVLKAFLAAMVLAILVVLTA